jgi:hypothetical protein
MTQPRSVDIRPGWKGLPAANALAYLTTSSVTRKKKFYNIDTCIRNGEKVMDPLLNYLLD